MASGKTRFVVDMEDGGERELFSIDENSKGGLTLNLPVDRPATALHVSPIEHRLSFHESLHAKDGGFAIKETYRDSGGYSKMNYAYVKPNDGHALLPVLARVPSSLLAAPDSTHKKRKATVHVFKGHTLGPIFFVVTVSREAIASRYFPGGTTLVERAFKRYRIYVTAGVFFHSTAFNQHITATMISKGPIENGIRHEMVANFDMPEAVSPTPDQLAFYVDGRIAFLSDAFREELMSCSFDGPELTINERLERIRNADLFMPECDVRPLHSVAARMKRWEAQPPEGLLLHPPGAMIGFRPMPSDDAIRA